MFHVKVTTNNPKGFRIYQCGGPVELQYGDTCLRLLLNDPDTRLDLPDGTHAYVMDASGTTIEQVRGQSRKPAETPMTAVIPTARALDLEPVEAKS